MPPNTYQYDGNRFSSFTISLFLRSIEHFVVCGRFRSRAAGGYSAAKGFCLKRVNIKVSTVFIRPVKVDVQVGPECRGRPSSQSFDLHPRKKRHGANAV